MKYTLQQLLVEHQVVIPQIQRDYAQGRVNQLDLRKGFVGAIKEALQTEIPPLNLDFVYGYTQIKDKNNIAFVPLDGQQRITTLWLVHWFLAPREVKKIEGKDVRCILQEVQDYLCKFTYETRSSSKKFCRSLVTHALPIQLNETMREHIKDSPWFMASWMNDPTIEAMLNMLDTIQEEEFNQDVAWRNLIQSEKITFDYIDIKSDEFKLTDELYIKMNSRGKPLTPFENFKAQFSSLLSGKGTDYINEKIVYEKTLVSYQDYFSFKIDNKWMDLFWNYRARVKTNIDTCILNFITYVAEFLYYKNNPNATSGELKKDFKFLNKVFSEKKNIDFLFHSLDFLSKTENLELFFTDLFDGLSTFDSHPSNYFLRSITGDGFDVKDRTLFYTILSYCINKPNERPNDELKDLIRIVRNLLLATRQQNASKRIEFERSLRITDVSSYCKFIDDFITKLSADKNLSSYEILAYNEFSGFNRENIESEKAKANLLTSNTKLRDSFFKLEEHRFIQGFTSTFILESKHIEEKIDAFLQIWGNDIPGSLIIRAFLTTGDYFVETHPYSFLGKILYFGGAENWNRILASIYKTERDKISKVLDRFLSDYMDIEGGTTIDNLNFMIDDFIASSKRDWRYYFIKYSAITDNKYIKTNLFSWGDTDGFGINNIGNSGKQPLSSYHLNPYLIAVKYKFINDSKVDFAWGRFSDISTLKISGRYTIRCVKEGWKISPNYGIALSQQLIKEFELKEYAGGLLLIETKLKDRIEIAEALITELLL